MSISKDQFRNTLGHFAAGVSVVTAKSSGGKPHGITVTAFSSLSLDPPLVLVCIDKRASLHEDLRLGSHFAVNILAEGQESASRLFAAKNADRFDGVPFTEGETGVPLLGGVLAFLECSIVNAYPGGDHTIFIGEVVASGTTQGRPLLYYCGNYERLP